MTTERSEAIVLNLLRRVQAVKMEGSAGHLIPISISFCAAPGELPQCMEALGMVMGTKVKELPA